VKAPQQRNFTPCLINSSSRFSPAWPIAERLFNYLDDEFTVAEICARPVAGRFHQQFCDDRDMHDKTFLKRCAGKA
jgi:hypothetical protein